MTTPGGAEAPRPLTADDVDWVVDLARARRAALEPHAPRFWRPAADADARHRAFLAHLVADDDTLALRTDHGFLLGVVAGTGRRVVDDMVVAPEGWDTEGVTLLQTARDTGPVRLVAPVHEERRRAAAEAAGFVPAETWWHRDLPPARVTAGGGAVELRTDGARGRLVPAPPVYDPGGPVLLVTEVTSAAALAAIEAEAGRRGATVAVVTQRPDDLVRELLLVEAGYVATTTFLEAPAATVSPA